MCLQYSEKVLNVRCAYDKKKRRPIMQPDGAPNPLAKTHGRGESGIAATPLLGRGESGIAATPLLGRGESGIAATPLLGRGESGIAATPLLSAILEMARLVPATSDKATTSERKRFPVCVMRVSP